jgi:non-ribosomal peptide synthase protein (TIGR01720 family)
MELAGVEAPRLPVDLAGGRNVKASARTASALLDAEETRALLQDVPAAYRTEINDVLLTALVLTTARLTGRRSLLVEMEGHGREDLFEDVDLSRTVGWFTSIFPVHLDLESAFDPGEALKAVKEQMRRIPNRGIGYGLLRYAGDDAETARALRALPAAEVSFNYLGQFDQMLPAASQFGVAAEHPGPSRNPDGGRGHLIEVSGLVAGGRLRVNWTYSENLHRRETVEALAQAFLGELRTLIAHCGSAEAGGFTPSDFADFDWSQSDLDSITAGISKATEEG